MVNSMTGLMHMDGKGKAKQDVTSMVFVTCLCSGLFHVGRSSLSVQSISFPFLLDFGESESNTFRTR